MKPDKLKPLINLLDDPDNEVYSVVSAQLINQGKHIIPELEKTWEYSVNESLQSRIEDIIHEIHFRSTQKDLSGWINNYSHNLFEGACLVAKHQYAELDVKQVQGFIDVIKRDVWLELNNNLTAMEKVKILNRIIFDIHGFAAVPKDMNMPHHYYINRLIENKKGNDISIGILYMIIAQKLDIPIYGVNFPHNFLLAYIDQYNYGKLFRDNILFYIDPINKGTIYGREELELFIEKLKIPTKKSFFTPCDNIRIIQRLISGLMTSYDEVNHNEKLNQLRELFSIVS